MPLALPAVERIFARLAVRYGSAWAAKWEGLDLAAVKADWSNELDAVTYEQIGYALAYLPTEWPPTAAWFREQALRMPQKVERDDTPLLPAPAPDLERLARELARLRDMQAQRRPLDWAYALQDREKSGERLTEGQRKAWRDALASPEVSLAGSFEPIHNDLLPAAMRVADKPRGGAAVTESERMADA